MLSTLGLILWATAMGLTLWGSALALRAFSRRPSLTAVAPLEQPPISILKPLKGSDPGLEANLESFFLLDYPHYELLFSVEDETDPAHDIVQRLLTKYPAVKAQLIVAKIEIGPNPKVNNLVFTYGRASHDWILISDSNIRVTPNYLNEIVVHLAPDVGLITAVVAGRDYQGIGGYLEAITLNTYFARGMHLAAAVGKPAALGKSMLFKRSIARRFGGIGTLSKYLAEDFMAGEAMRALGLRVVIMNAPIAQQIGQHSLGAFWDRHVRWGRIRKAQAPLAFAAEGVFGALPAGIIGAVAAQAQWGIPMSLFFAVHLTLWSFCDVLLIRKLSDGLDPRIAPTWFLRELVAPCMWITIALGNTVKWRGQRYTIERGGTLRCSTQPSQGAR